MAEELPGCAIVVLATKGVEQIELTEPVKALKKAGAQVEVISDKNHEIQAYKHHEKAAVAPVDAPLDKADPQRQAGGLAGVQ